MLAENKIQAESEDQEEDDEENKFIIWADRIAAIVLGVILRAQIVTVTIYFYRSR